MVYFISIFRGKASEFISNIVLKLMLYIAKCKQNAHNDGNRAQPLKRLLETLFLTIKKCIGFTTDMYISKYIYFKRYVYICTLSKDFIIRKATARNIRNLLKGKPFSKMEKMLTCRWLKTKILYQ